MERNGIMKILSKILTSYLIFMMTSSLVIIASSPYDPFLAIKLSGDSFGNPLDFQV